MTVWIKDGLLVQLASDGLPAMDVGAWAENKHYYLGRYCDMFAVGMSKKWPRRYYIDLFSGSGIGINRETGQESQGKRDVVSQVS